MKATIQKISKKRYRSREEILELLDKSDHREGISVKEFCRQHTINQATYYNWQIRYRGKLRKEPKSAGFIEIIPSSPCVTAVSPVLFAEVRGIRLYQPVSSDYLKTLAQ